MARRSPLGIEGVSVSFRDKDETGRLTSAQVRVRDERGAYQGRRFAVQSWRKDGTPILPDEAMAWAKSQRTAFMRGEAVAQAGSFQEFAEVLALNLEAQGVGHVRVRLVRQVATALAREGITNMQAQTFPGQVRRWLTNLKACWSMPEDAPNRRKTPQPLSPRSRNVLLIVCRQVTKLAVQRRRLAYDPLQELGTFKEEKRLKALFTIDELRRMVSDEARDHNHAARVELEAKIKAHGGSRLAAVQAIASERGCHWTSIYNALRRPLEPDPWWLACCLLVYTGCRAQEAMHLRWEWIKWDQNLIELRLAEDYDQKTDTERLIPLEPELREILHPLAKPAGHILAPEIRAGGSGMKANARAAGGKGAGDYTAALGRYLHRIGMELGDRTAHSLRHMYITLKIARHDCNVDRLRKAVGHADMKTTQGYSRESQRFEGEVDRWPDRWLWLRRAVPVANRQKTG